VASKSENMSIIDRGLTVDGTISSSGKLIVKGIVKGTLTGDIIIIAEEGAVYAETSTNSMTVGGQFEGDLKVSKNLVILSTGSCSGKVVCKDLSVEAGGILNAEVTCVAKKEPISEKKVLGVVKK